MPRRNTPAKSPVSSSHSALPSSKVSTAVREKSVVLRTWIYILVSPKILNTSPYRKGTSGISVHAFISFPHSLAKYFTPYNSRCLACVKYLEASTTTSGSDQNKAEVMNAAKKRYSLYDLTEKRALEIKNAGIKPPARIRKIMAASALWKASCQLVSLLSSRALKLN